MSRVGQWIEWSLIEEHYYTLLQYLGENEIVYLILSLNPSADGLRLGHDDSSNTGA